MDKNYLPEIDLLGDEEQRRNRVEKLLALIADGESPYLETTADVTGSAVDVSVRFDELEGQTLALAGRIMSRRGMGKVSFSDLQDSTGRLQVFTKIDVLGEEEYARWQSLDIGDLVWVEGVVFRTRRGEISINNHKFKLLAKCLRPLPEKFHGLTNIDTRYRKRYIDLIMNPDVRETFRVRSRILSSLRRQMEARGFLEVETPILSMVAGGAAARPFETHHNALNVDLTLRIAPELYLKRLVVGGLERVFELGRMFRNEGMSVKHNPEFTMLEGYQAYTDYRGMMELMEQLVSKTAEEVLGTTKIDYQGVAIDLTLPFARKSMVEAVKEVTGLDFAALSDEEAHRQVGALELDGYKPSLSRGELLWLLFEEKVEETLIQPVFIYGYPIEVSPLAKQYRDNLQMTERLELFMYGREFGNAYSELNDPFEQQRRFADQVKRREKGDEEATLADEDYIEALEYGLPPTGGFGIGVDRLVMLLTDSASIRDVLLFPTMKPPGGQ
jgi:lysyl-tRNA synthetase class 2